jgi:DNA-binding NarL/FixJ family response regulator
MGAHQRSGPLRSSRMKKKKPRHYSALRSKPAKVSPTRRRSGVPPDPSKVLTPREIEVVRLLAAGLRNREIARRLLISEGTVKIHLHNVFSKLGMDNRLALGLYAKEKRLT